MLRVHESAKTKLATKKSELKFNIARQRFIVDTSFLSEASDAIQAACNLESTVQNSAVSRQGVLADANLFSSELAFTAITACHLDRFLFFRKGCKSRFLSPSRTYEKKTKATRQSGSSWFLCVREWRPLLWTTHGFRRRKTASHSGHHPWNGTVLLYQLPCAVRCVSPVPCLYWFALHSEQACHVCTQCF